MKRLCLRLMFLGHHVIGIKQFHVYFLMHDILEYNSQIIERQSLLKLDQCFIGSVTIVFVLSVDGRMI